MSDASERLEKRMKRANMPRWNIFEEGIRVKYVVSLRK